jgi:hypothetical protein
MAIAVGESIEGGLHTQARRYLSLTMNSGRSPLRARSTIEGCRAEWLAAHPQPHGALRSKFNLRRRNLLDNNNTAVVKTIASETNCCQSMVARYA